MNWTKLVAVAAVLLGGVILFTSSVLSAGGEWKPPREALIGIHNHTIYSIQYEAYPVVVYFPEDVGVEVRSSSNRATRSYTTDATVRRKKEVLLEIKGQSEKPDELQLNGKSYDLRIGSVFRLTDKGEVLQLPFRPLDASPAYVDALSSFFEK